MHRERRLRGYASQLTKRLFTCASCVFQIRCVRLFTTAPIVWLAADVRRPSTCQASDAVIAS